MARPLPRTLLPIGVLAALTAGVVVAASAGGGGGTAVAPPGTDLEPVSLASFSSCDALLDHYRDEAGQLVGPYGLGGQMVAFGAEMTAVGGAAAPAAAARDTAAGGSDGAGTGTNVQVGGVDEADVAKLVDGRLYSLTDGVLRVTDISGGTPELLGSMTLKDWYADQLLVAGDRLLLSGSGGYPVAELSGRAGSGAVEDRLMPPGTWMPQSRLAEVDVSDPASPRLVRVLDLDGSLVGARLVDGIARLAVTASTARLPFVYPSNESKAAQDRAEKTNKDLVKSSTLADWLPRYVERTVRVNGAISTGGSSEQLVDCQDVAAPSTFSGLDTLTLMTVDLAGGGLAQWDSAAVLASGTTVYATAEHTYVATSPWVGWGGPATLVARGGGGDTSIHLFATANDAAPRYVASGSVPGMLLGQYALDEQDGVLRVASTRQQEFIGSIEPGVVDDGVAEDEVVVPSTGEANVDDVAAPPESAGEGAVSPDTPVGSSSGSDSGSSSGSGGAAVDVMPVPMPTQPSIPSESFVTTLRVSGTELVTVGSVGGLGKGETIRSVRFLGDVGYVVTFRQTDPLYTIDLSDPAEPTVTGELKILGYSGYLHPAGDGLLLGIGQDATKDGQTTGLQLSLFDVSDPAEPQRVDQVTLPAAWSSADGDAHAFTYSGGLALAPFETWTDVPSTDNVYRSRYDAGVVAVRVEGRTLAPEKLLRAVGDGPVVIDPNKDLNGTEKDATIGRSIMRTYVVDGKVFGLTTTGVSVHDATTLDRVGFTKF